MSISFSHTSVMLWECISALNINPNGVYVDGTTGGAGHSLEIAKCIKDGKLICFDKDPDAVQTIEHRLRDYPFVTVINDDFVNIKPRLEQMGVQSIDGLLLDLGVSSHQLDTVKRGFSYQQDAPLDMRMSQSGISAKDIVNTFSEQELSKIIFQYGEEKYSRQIAKTIVNRREKSEIATTFELVECIKEAVPAKVKRDRNPSRKTFQAIRIAVNNELGIIEKTLKDAFSILEPGGRIAVITFHSLEDRIVKKTFAEFAQGCDCPPSFPVCVCGKVPEGKIVNKKPIVASNAELEVNRRSRSAKLRIIEKIVY